MSVRLGMGFKELKPLENPDLGVASMLVKDPDGYPFYWLNLVGSGVNDFWKAVENPADDYTVYATGALDVRDFFGDIYPAEFLKQVRAICETAGGCRGFVGTGTGLYVVGDDGRWYDPDSGKALSDEEIELEIKLYHAIRESLEGSAFLTRSKNPGPSCSKSGALPRSRSKRVRKRSRPTADRTAIWTCRSLPAISSASA